MLSKLEARRIALAAQGLGKARPGRVTVAHLEATVRRIAPLQLDFAGKLLWETLLPFAGNATPATYSIRGKQYVVIAAGAGRAGRPRAGFMWRLVWSDLVREDNRNRGRSGALHKSRPCAAGPIW